MPSVHSRANPSPLSLSLSLSLSLRLSLSLSLSPTLTRGKVLSAADTFDDTILDKVTLSV
jgi:hypothetical protein